MSRSEPKREASFERSPLGRGDLAASLLYIFPLFLFYQVGVTFTSTVNGADFVTRAVYSLAAGDRETYLAIHLAIAVCFLGLVLFLRHRRGLKLGDALPMLLESAIYALTLGSLIIVIMDKALGLSLWTEDLAIGAKMEPFVASMGAGVYEELVFRLGLFAGLAMVVRALGVRMVLALLFAAIVSSAMFSYAHHIGPMGEPFATRVFVYRALAGLAFTAIFYFRLLAHAVYAHFLYDVYVLVIYP